MRDGCVFCDYEGPSPVLKDTSVMVPAGVSLDDWMLIPYFVIEPLNPVTPGHRLVIPREHRPDFRTHPRLLGGMMLAASMVAADEAADAIVDGSSLGHNLIVSAGAEATQTVPHVHVHVVPRREGDGLMLPWSDTVMASEDQDGGTFTYFLPHGLLRVESGDVVTAFIRARDAVDAYTAMGSDPAQREADIDRLMASMRRLERAVYPERREGPGDAWSG